MSGKAACFDKSLFFFLHPEGFVFNRYLINAGVYHKHHKTAEINVPKATWIEQKKASYFEMVLKCGFQLDLKYWFFTSTFIMWEGRKVPVLNPFCTEDVNENLFGQVD